jgi:hypothetical protein
MAYDNNMLDMQNCEMGAMLMPHTFTASHDEQYENLEKNPSFIKVISLQNVKQGGSGHAKISVAFSLMMITNQPLTDTTYMK